MPSDLAAKARANSEYSFDFKATAGGQSMTGKTYVKASKMRQEMTVAGMNSVMLMDLSNKTAYMMLPGQNTAMKLDFSQAAEQGANPAEQVGSLPSNARFVGTDTVDGKPAAVYEVPSDEGTSKMWIWIERGLPLKVERTGATGQVVAEFTNYQFGPQPDSLFELPPGTQVVELPTGMPGAQGTPGAPNIPVPGKAPTPGG